MRKNKITQVILLGAGLAFGAASLSVSAAQVPEGTKLAKEQTLVRDNGTEVASIDPQKTEGVPESNVIRDMFEGLVIQDGEGNIIPGVAESWETQDNKTFTFHLRKDAKWSNGDPVTAEDFVFAWQRAVDPATASPYATYLKMATMKNAGAIIDGKADKSTLGVKAIDSHTLQVELDASVPYFVQMAAHTTMMPVNKKVVEKWGDEWTKAEHMVSNGAFKLEKWVINERMVLVRNTEYWDNKDTVLDKVVYLPIENQVSAMNRFLAGEVDMTYEIPNQQYKSLKKQYPETIKNPGYLCTYYYGFNTAKKPFDDVRVREALSYAIDRDVITRILLGQGQKPAYALTPDVTAGFTAALPDYAKLTQKERIEKAKELLNAAGFDKGHPLSFNLLYNTSENHKKLAVAIASMWKKSLGVNVTIENQEWKTYLDNRREGNYDVMRAGWCGDYNEASTFLSIMRSDNSSNDMNYDSKAYDAAIDNALNSTDDKKRASYYQEAESLLAKDMPLAPIYQYVAVRQVNPLVGGYPKANAQDNIYSKDLYKIAK
ncbi:ABC transporter substrate-binding protein [Vibrio rumoiensis]|uniref:ABC transporter substrate-binding protein n=1 Tax=Vibrio rumoiensis TaxID=76258 RepID=UPI003AA99C80